VRFSVDPWDPGYGTSVEGEAPASTADVRLDVEVAERDWRPVRPPPGTDAPDAIVFVDGVRRVDARSWVSADDGADPQPGLFASYAAGAVRCDGRARVVEVEVRRCAVAASRVLDDVTTAHGTYEAIAARDAAVESLTYAVHQAMTDTEVLVAERARAGTPALVVVDGPLRRREHLPDTVGFVKTHHVRYLPPDADALVARLAPGERTPVFLLASVWNRYAWYARLPGPDGGPWAGVVRCEASPALAPARAVALADAVTHALPRFASEPHKDPRAPQNLYPIGGLERELRRRLGDPLLLYRALRAAAAA
jgi:hypothetical protein